MKLTVSRLRGIIKEEIGRALAEARAIDINDQGDVDAVLNLVLGKVEKDPRADFGAALGAAFATYGHPAPSPEDIAAWEAKWETWAPKGITLGSGRPTYSRDDHVGSGAVKMSGRPGIGIGIASRRGHS